MLSSKDLSLLHDFAIVCREGNLTKAAKELNTVQSAITQRMQRLEDVMGTPLLTRHSRGVSPNEKGVILLKYAKRLSALMEDAITEIQSWEESPSGSVAIGLPPSVAAVLASPLIKEVRTELPNVELTVAEAFSGYLFNWLENEEIDFAFLFDQGANSQIESIPLLEEHLFLITDPATAASLPSKLSIEDIAQIPLIAPSRRHGLRNQVGKEAEKRGLELNISLEIDAGHQLIRQISSETGSAVLARSAVMQELDTGLLTSIPIVSPPLKRNVCLAIKKERQNSFLLNIVRKKILSVIKKLVDEQQWLGTAFKTLN